MPTSSSLVTNLPADFNTFGQGVDTSLQDLLGGTTGQVLSKTSNTNMDFTWVTPTDQTPLTTKGDLFTFSTVDARLGVGADGTTLVADSTASTGLKWATPSSGTQSFTKIATSSFSAVATTSTTFDSVFTATYKKYLVIMSEMIVSSSDKVLQLQFRTGGSTNATSYYGASTSINSAGTTRQELSSNASQFAICRQSDVLKNSYNFYFVQVGNGSQKPSVYMQGLNNYDNGPVSFAGIRDVASVVDGFILSSVSGNITGTVTIFGIVD
ncbi:hypothetical protein UFOVP801_19 [uncultured Caudovirales phage]|uniref:Uncharacterized protein n=1 Tax=uncultured Caudovirales phage TaxID=2100421 RepID=A0A6J5NUF9_9CAUD|nr:hypothetical protein UFOVP801_19 [uncultured Caudovirales phage]